MMRFSPWKGLVFPTILCAQVDFYLPPVTVTATRMQTVLASETREWIPLTGGEIQTLPVHSVPDLLAQTGVEVGRRGVHAQADFGIRGGSFEQVLVLVDGVRINDPQTGHFLSDLPFQSFDIARIEVLPGHASSLYGPEGYGVIHIQTRIPEKDETRLSFRSGSFGTVGGWAGQSIRTGPWAHGLSFGLERSGGYRPETGYALWTVQGRTVYQKARFLWDQALSYGDRDFGANGFYAPYPSHERTKTALFRSALTWKPSGELRLTGRLFFRRHDDDFVLDAERPSWYRNTHRSIGYGTEWVLNRLFGGGFETALGVEAHKEALNSSRLGRHQRNRFGLFGEAAWKFPFGLLLSAGMRADHLDPAGWIVSPSIGLAYPFHPGWILRASAGRMFRQPSFTELYYEAPTHRGDPTLRPERGTSVEVGISRPSRVRAYEVTLFARREVHLIDWIETSPRVWQAAHLEDRTVWGTATMLSGEAGPFRYRLRNEEFWREEVPLLDRARYGANAPRRRFTTTIGILLPRGIESHLTYRHTWRLRRSDGGWMDLRLSRRWKFGRIFLDLHNLLNQRIEEIPGVPLPGRYGMIGFHFPGE